MIFDVFAGILGSLIFLFIFWKKLREDYAGVQVFNSAIYILLGVFIGYFLAIKFYQPIWFWSGFFGLLAGLLLAEVRYKFRFFETLEAIVIGALPGLSLVFLSDSIKTSSIYSFIAFGVVVLLMGLYYYLDKYYKTFSWYRSGRIGFSGLSVAGLLFLLRALFALPFSFVLSFVNRYEVILSSVTAFIFFLLTFNLARKEI